MQDEITSALGLPDLPPAVFDRTREAILKDNFLYNRILGYLILGAAPKVIASLHPMEREALRKKVGFAAKEKGKAIWGIIESTADVRNPQQTLKATCPACNQESFFTAPKEWRETKTVDRGGGLTYETWKDHPVTEADIKAHMANLQWHHCGHTDKCPAEIALVWEERLLGALRK